MYLSYLARSLTCRLLKSGTKVLDKFGVNYQLRVALLTVPQNLLKTLFVQGRGRRVQGSSQWLVLQLHYQCSCSINNQASDWGSLWRASPIRLLLSIVQLPPGVPAATVGVDRGDNAGHLAVQMLALVNDDMAQRLVQDKLDQVERFSKWIEK